MIPYNNKNGENNYYVKPLSVVNLNKASNIITYLSVNGYEVDLFAILDGAPFNHFRLPVIKNVVSAHGIEDSIGFTGMNLRKDTDGINKYNLFMLRYTIDSSRDGNYYSLDTLPYNTDCFGAVPAFDAITLDKDYSLVYTSYDDNHKGSLKLRSLDQDPKVIAVNENIKDITDMIN